MSAMAQKFTLKWLPIGALFALLLWVVPQMLPQGPSAALDAGIHLQGGNFLVAAGIIFLGGFLTSLTPCVYPLIPITVSVFGARQADSRLKAVVLTLLYIFGMGLLFSILGVVAALSGKAFGTALGNVWVVAGLSLFLLALATSMFGAFELALPSGLATRLNHVGGSGYLGAFLMGSVSGLLAAPCTGPVLTGVLTFVAQTQNALLGGGLLFVYALGIGVPFFLIGVFTVRLPKGGVWMEWIKSVFGIALVALAVAYLRDVWPAFRGALTSGVAQLGQGWAVAASAVLVALGVWLGAIYLSFKEGVGQAILKGFGVFLVVAAVLLRISASHPVSAGEMWAMTFPKAGEVPTTSQVFESALAKAKSDGKPVMLDFFAEWCEACKELDRHTYSDSAVRQELQRFENIMVDSTESNDVMEKLWETYQIQGLPTVVFIDSKGRVLDSPRILGFVEAGEFLGELKKVE